MPQVCPLARGLERRLCAMQPIKSAAASLPDTESGFTGKMTITATTTVLPGDLFPASVPGYGPHYAPMVPLTGAALLAHTERLQSAFGGSRTDLVRAAGYIRPDGRVRYIEFYEQLLAAKTELDPNFGNNIEEEQEYDAMTIEQQSLYDYVHKTYGETWDHQDIVDFMCELKDLNIESVSAMEDCFRYRVDNGWNWEAELAEEITCELEYNLTDSIVFSAIDWQKVWDHTLCYDYDWFDFDGDVYVFCKV